MIKQGRVKTVTVGGRPNSQPMAVIGGTQGGAVESLESLIQIATEAVAVQAIVTGNSSAQADQARKALDPLVSSPPLSVAPGPDVVGVNFLDNIAENDTSAIPLQFSGGIPADCRFYYMPKDIVSVANTWARVAEGVKVKGKGLCVNGTMKTSSTASTNASVGSAPVTFLGSASVTVPANLGGLLPAIIAGVVAILL